MVPLLAALALLGGCEKGSVQRAATVSMLEGQRFSPETLEVAAGTTVTFGNDSAEAHTVTAYEGRVPSDAEYFSSGGFESEEEARDSLAGAIVGQEDTFQVTFDVPGTYEYFCIPHEQQGMKGTIVVGP